MGMCLKYVQDAFGSGWAGSYALQGWRDIVKKKHTNRNIPSGVYVPIWFEGYWNGFNYGHVAIYKDGTVWSSPYTNKRTHDRLGSIQEVERVYGMKYIGWSEDIGGTTVIRKGDDMITQNQLNVLWRFYFGKAPTSAENKTYVGKKTFAQTHDIILKGQGLKNRVNNARAGKLVATNHLPAVVRKVYVDPNAVALKKALASLAAAEKSQALNDSLTKQVVEARKETETALKRIAKLEAEKQEATATGNAFMRWIGEVLNTILRKG